MVLANKQDLGRAVNPIELVEKLQLERLESQGHRWSVQAATATNGDGLVEAMEMAALLSQQFVEESQPRT